MITLTEAASTELKSLMEKATEDGEITSEAGLRVMIAGTGCSGFNYRMGFDKNVRENDSVFDVDGVKVICDEQSLIHMKGTEIDFQDGMHGKGFVFNNPNAPTNACGGCSGGGCG